MMRVLRRLRAGTMAPPRADWNEIFWAWAGSCLSIISLALLEKLCAQEWNLPLLIGSFGASAVLAFGAPHSPLAQPRNLVGGHVLSALVGVSCQLLFSDNPVLASGLAVSTAIALMLVPDQPNDLQCMWAPCIRMPDFSAHQQALATMCTCPACTRWTASSR